MNPSKVLSEAERAALAAKFLRSVGVDASAVLEEGISRDGYYRVVQYPNFWEKKFTAWPSQEIGERVMDILRGDEDEYSAGV